MTSAHQNTDIDYAARAKETLGYSRWWQIVAAAVMMALVSPYQYVWSSLEGPLAVRLDVSLAVLGFVFTIYVVVMSLTQFPAGWYRDRHGPRTLTLFAGVLAGAGYYGTAVSAEIWQLYLSYAVGAVGVGIVYTIAVNTAIKWFPDKRGLTTGIGTMAFGGGSALFVPYVRANSTPEALPGALQVMGLLIAVGIIVGAVVLKDPPSGFVVEESFDPDDATSNDSDPDDDTGHDSDDDTESGTVAREDGGYPKQYTWQETVRTWQFWSMYIMFTFVAAAGLMITARVVLYAEHLGLTALVATVAATLLPIASGGGRLIIGGLSDRMPRERVMAGSFLLCGIGTLAIVAFGAFEFSAGYVFAVVVAVFFWSSQFSLFPSTVADYYGHEHSSSNYALLYSSKMWGGVFGGGVVGWLVVVIGWDASFVLGGVMALIAGIMGLFLRPPDGRSR